MRSPVEHAELDRLWVHALRIAHIRRLIVLRLPAPKCRGAPVVLLASPLRFKIINKISAHPVFDLPFSHEVITAQTPFSTPELLISRTSLGGTVRSGEHQGFSYRRIYARQSSAVMTSRRATAMRSTRLRRTKYPAREGTASADRAAVAVHRLW